MRMESPNLDSSRPSHFEKSSEIPDHGTPYENRQKKKSRPRQPYRPSLHQPPQFLPIPGRSRLPQRADFQGCFHSEDLLDQVSFIQLSLTTWCCDLRNGMRRNQTGYEFVIDHRLVRSDIKKILQLICKFSSLSTQIIFQKLVVFTFYQLTFIILD